MNSVPSERFAVSKALYKATLGQYARQNPQALVVLFFENERGQRGHLVTTAAHAANPNASGRYFPPQTPGAFDGVRAARMGWPVPYWYAEEVKSWAAYLPEEG